MAHEGFRRAALAGFGVAAALVSGAWAPEYRTDLAPRCAPLEARYLTGSDPCEPHYAVFGVTGPTIVTRDAVDVDATGSVAPRSARHDPPANAAAK